MPDLISLKGSEGTRSVSLKYLTEKIASTKGNTSYIIRKVEKIKLC